MRFALIVALLLALGAVVFALQNPADMSVRIGPWIYTGSTALVLLMTFGAGVLTAFLAGLPARIAQSRQIGALRKEQNAAVKAPSMGTPPRSVVKTPAELDAGRPAPPPADGEVDPYTARFGKPPHDVG
jgi:putative membrane protein